MNSSWQFTHFHSRRCIWTCRLENGSHFVSASMCKNVNTNNNYSLTMFTSDILSKLANDNSISIYSGFPEMKHRETIKPWLIVWVTGMAVLITQHMGGAQPIRLEIHKEKMHCETFINHYSTSYDGHGVPNHLQIHSLFNRLIGLSIDKSSEFCTTGSLWGESTGHQRNLLTSQRGSQIAKFMGPTWGPPESCRPQMGPMLALWTLLTW